MSTVGIRDLKNGLTKYLRRIKKGKKVVVTERGHPIAVIQAIGSSRRASSLEARLAALAARGVITLPRRRVRRRKRLVSVRGDPFRSRSSKTVGELLRHERPG